MFSDKNNLYQMSVQEINIKNIPKNLNQHQEILLIDLYCNETEDLLLNVIKYLLGCTFIID